MPSPYFVKRSGTSLVVGPLTSSNIKSMASSGELRPEDEIGSSPNGPWRMASKIGKIAFSEPSPSPIEQSITRVPVEDRKESELVRDRQPLAPVAPAMATSTAGAASNVVIIRHEAVSPSGAIQFAIDRFSANPLFYILSSILVALVVLIPGAGFWFIAAPVLIGFYQCVRDEITTGKPASFAQVFSGYKQLIPALVIGFWGSLVVMLGLVFCCVPGLVLLPVPFLAFIVAGRERAGGLKALTRALRVVEKDPLGLFASCILLSLIGMSGLLVCYIGVVVTLPIMLLGMYSVADQLLSTEDA